MIAIRNFKETDLVSLNTCVSQKIIPVVPFMGSYTSKELLDYYMQFNFETEFAYVITNENDDFLGAIDALLVDTLLVTSYYLLPSVVGKGICTQGMSIFIDLIKRDFRNIKTIGCQINRAKRKSENVVKRLGFSVTKKDSNEICQLWKLRLSRNNKKPL